MKPDAGALDDLRCAIHTLVSVWNDMPGQRIDPGEVETEN